MNSRARLIAFYLPQFHPIPENDGWWGQGFTEWANVIRARPLFKGHYQPHIPADLGFYDLRLSETRVAQAELASKYGIDGFCYYHYWFNGKQLLERPFNEVVSSGKPEFPFCLAWANESWSRRWLGEDKDILIEQTYSSEDDLNHARWLVKIFADPRYIKVDGRPLFLIYRPTHLPEPNRTVEIVRRESIRGGLKEPYLLGINGYCWNVDCRTIGFDGTLNFEPNLGFLADFLDDHAKVSKLKRNLGLGVVSAKLKIYDYGTARGLMHGVERHFPLYPCIFVAWDNSPRRGENGIIIVNSSPEAFEAGLKKIIQSVEIRPKEERLVFINAWNEWAEGNHLEPDLRHGVGYLEAVKRANSVHDFSGAPESVNTPLDV